MAASVKRGRVGGGLKLTRMPPTLLGFLEVEGLACVKVCCREGRVQCEEWARCRVRELGWHRGDGIGSWVERLGRRVCVLDAGSFECLDGGRSTEKADESGVVRSRSSQGGGEWSKAATFSRHGSRVRVVQPGRYVVCGAVEPSASDEEARRRHRGGLVSGRRRHHRSRGGGQGSAGTREQQRQIREDDDDNEEAAAADSEQYVHEWGRRKRARLSYRLRVVDKDSCGHNRSLSSSVYAGVATSDWAMRTSRQAVRSTEAWLLDLRRGRFVHEYPTYDRRVAASRGSNRARALASTDDVVRDGDVLGVKVYDDAVVFYKNGARLAFGCGGGGSDVPDPQRPVPGERSQVYGGWGRPVPSETRLVPIVELHARAGPDGQACNVHLEIAAWDDDARHDHDSSAFFASLPPSRHRSALDVSGNDGVSDDDQSDDGTTDDTAPDPARLRRRRLYAESVPVPIRKAGRCLWKAAYGLTRAVASRLPGLLGLAQLGLDLISLASDDLVKVRAFFDAFALSVAVSTVWKTHYYDHRVPRRSRRGLRALLRAHLAKCLLLALFSALVLEPTVFFVFAGRYPSSRSSGRAGFGVGGAATNAVLCGERDAPRATVRAATSAASWLLAELTVELGLQSAARAEAWLLRRLRDRETRARDRPRLLQQQGAQVAQPDAQHEQQQQRAASRSNFAAALRNFPVGHDSVVGTARGILRFFLMILIVPGSASLVLAIVKDRLVPGPLEACALDVLTPPQPDPRLLDAADLAFALVYPAVAAWWCFALFVKFGFLVFGLHALCGFEDFSTPGWLLG